jgi:hypothetical protein
MVTPEITRLKDRRYAERDQRFERIVPEEFGDW